MTVEKQRGKTDMGFILSLIGLFVAPVLAGGIALLLDQTEVATGLWVFWLFSSWVGCIWFGYRLGQNSLITGGRIVMEAQTVNDRWDAQKTAAMAAFARTIYSQRASPAALPTTWEDDYTPPALVEFNVK